MKIMINMVAAFLTAMPAVYASDLDISELAPASDFAEIDAVREFLGLADSEALSDMESSEMDLLSLDRRPPPPPRRPNPPPPRRPNPPPPPPRRPPPPPYRPAPPPPYRPVPPPPYRRPIPRPGYPHYSYYTCFAENYFGDVYSGNSDFADWAQREALRQCELWSRTVCRPLGCRVNY